jgi:hypothetical protein
MGSGGGSNVTFEGNVVHKGSVAIRETGGGTDSVTLAGPASTTGYTITLPGTAPSASNSLTFNGSSYVWSQVSLSAGVTGTLPLANGGTNKNLTAVAGGVVWTDSDSMEVTSAGTAGDWLISNGTSAPSFSSTTTTAKTIDGSADVIQLTVQGHSTQTSDIFVVEKSDGTDLLDVTNANGTNIRGTTTNDSAASGFVGEVVSSVVSNVSFPTSGQWGDVTSIALTAGDWDITYVAAPDKNGATVTVVVEYGISTTSGNSSSGLTYGSNYLTAAWFNSDAGGCIANFRASISASTTYYAKVKTTYSVATPRTSARLYARRIR